MEKGTCRFGIFKLIIPYRKALKKESYINAGMPVFSAIQKICAIIYFYMDSEIDLVELVKGQDRSTPQQQIVLWKASRYRTIGRPWSFRRDTEADDIALGKPPDLYTNNNLNQPWELLEIWTLFLSANSRRSTIPTFPRFGVWGRTSPLYTSVAISATSRMLSGHDASPWHKVGVPCWKQIAFTQISHRYNILGQWHRRLPPSGFEAQSSVCAKVPCHFGVS